MFVACAPLASGCARTQIPSSDTTSLDALAWLGGTWRSTRESPLTIERWNLARDGVMRGASTTQTDGNTVHHELLLIDARGGRVRYVAAPQGQAVTEFALVTSRANFARFENRGHDFPQWIEYRREGSRLTARIGASSEQPRVVEWSFELSLPARESALAAVRICANREQAQEINVTVPPCTCGATVLCREIGAGAAPLALAVFDTSCDACMESTGRCVAPQTAARALGADGGCVTEQVRAVY